MSYILINQLSSTPLNSNVGYNNSWLEVENNANRDLFAQASYITNFDDLTISLSAGNVTIGAMEIKDGNSNLKADVTESDGLNALRVLTQDLESSVDDITIGDKQGNLATVDQNLSALNVKVTNTLDVVSNPVATQLDAFGRLRVSTAMTLFDSSHRYRDNNLWASLTAVNGIYSFNKNQGLIDMTVTSASGSSVIRETTKVFAYQPGKSLLAMNTFVFAPSSTNLRQRAGYFGFDNGIYFQLDDDIISFVKRTLVNGSPSQETIIPLSGWNIDKMDGTGPSGFTLDITKAQIFWMDIEWLGVGTVRCGFVIDGKFVHCHSFHHANIIASTYITTASLPLRYEITNKAVTTGSATMKQICSTVLSEGGYELRGAQQAVGTPITQAKNLATQGIYYPIVSIKLKPTDLDAIVVPTALSIMPVESGNFNWQVIASGTTTGGAWLSGSNESAVQYNITGTGHTGGRILASGFVKSTNTVGNTIDILREALFKFQLERNGLTGVPFELCLVMACSENNKDVYASIDWEEISR